MKRGTIRENAPCGPMVDCRECGKGTKRDSQKVYRCRNCNTTFVPEPKAAVVPAVEVPSTRKAEGAR